MFKATIIGRVGQDATMKVLPNGSTVVNFSVAIDKGYKDKQGQWVSNTIWQQCTLFGKLGEALAKHLTKGKQVYLECEPMPVNYTDKNGVQHSTFNMKVTEIKLLSSSGEGAAAAAAKSNSDSAVAASSDNAVYEDEQSPQLEVEEDIPF